MLFKISINSMGDFQTESGMKNPGNLFNPENPGSDNTEDAEKWWDDYGKKGNA